MGVVEDRQDPLKIGRCRVRVLGYHTEDKNEIPTDELPWAYPAMPINTKPRGTPVGPVEGTWVMGFFRDGENAQQPVMTHNIDYGYATSNENGKGFNAPSTAIENKPNRPAEENWPMVNEINTHRLSRGEVSDTWVEKQRSEKVVGVESANKGRNWDEPDSVYNAKFPYNSVSESESGHVFEVDDTPGAERLVKRHRAGTFEEIYPDGRRVVKVAGDDFEIVNGNKRIYIKDNTMDLKVDGDLNIKVKGNLRFDIGGQFRVKTTGSASLGAIVLQAGIPDGAPPGFLGGAPVLVNGTMLGTNAGTPIFHGGGSPFVIPAPMPVTIAPDLGMMGAGSALESTNGQTEEDNAKAVDIKSIQLDPELIMQMARDGKVEDPQGSVKGTDKAIDPNKLEGNAVIDIETRIVWEDVSIRKVRLGRKYRIKRNSGLPFAYWERLGASSITAGTEFYCKELPDSTYFFYDGQARDPIVRHEVLSVADTGKATIPGTSMTDRLEEVYEDFGTSKRVTSYNLSVPNMLAITDLGVLLSVVLKVYLARTVVGLGSTVKLASYLGVRDYEKILEKISFGTGPGGISSIKHLTLHIDDLIMTRERAEQQVNIVRTNVWADNQVVDVIKDANPPITITGDLYKKKNILGGWKLERKDFKFVIEDLATMDHKFRKNRKIEFRSSENGLLQKRVGKLGQWLRVDDFQKEFNWREKQKNTEPVDFSKLDFSNIDWGNFDLDFGIKDPAEKQKFLNELKR